MKFTGAAQGLSGPTGMGVFAGMVDDHHGQLKLPLELAQVREQGGDLGGIIFIHAMQADQGIEDQQDRP